MDIHFRCAKCGHNIAASVDCGGHTVACPQCGQALAIPASSSPPGPEPEARRSVIGKTRNEQMNTTRFVAIALIVVPVIHAVTILFLFNRIIINDVLLLPIAIGACLLQVLAILIVARRTRKLPVDTSPRRQKRVNAAIGGALGSFFVLVVVTVVAGLGAEGVIKKRFAPYISEYIAYNRMEAAKEAPYLNGKVVMVNIDDATIDSRYFEIDSDIRALYPEEAGSVILLSWGRNQVYTDKIRTYEVHSGRTVGMTDHYRETQFCDITVVDLRARKVFASTRVSNTGSGKLEEQLPIPQGGAEYPSNEVVRYVEQLPRR